ncbi:MAG TPA: hypothetical protein V6D05_05405 [Stenomitos sp.]
MTLFAHRVGAFRAASHVFLVIALLAIAGCAGLFGRSASSPADEPARRGTRPIAIVEFLDLTGQEVGTTVTQAFWSQARADLRDAIAESPVPRPGPRLANSWLKAQGDRLRVGTFLTGTISSYRIQTRQQRVWVTLSVRLIAADSGRILWSKRLVGTEALDPATSPATAFERAVRSAAREFTHEVLPSS